MSDRLFIVDGTAFAYRSFYAIRNLTNAAGVPVNAVFGFARVMLRLLREQAPSHLVFVFDAPGKTFRSEQYPEYKANREATPEELLQQFPMMDEVVEALGAPNLRVPGVEADDVMGALARAAEKAGMEAVLVTGDKDAMQLITDHVCMYDPHKGTDGTWYTTDEVIERFGVPPERVPDALGLMGDSADNVPGVRGIGPKTAKKLLEQYGSLEGLYEHIHELKGKQRERIETDRDTAFLSRDLTTIKVDVPLPVDLKDCRCAPLDAARMAAVFDKLQLPSLVQEFLPDAAALEELDYRLLLTREDLESAMTEMRAAGEFAVDTETTSVDPMRAVLVGISMSCKANTGYYLPVGHTENSLRDIEPPGDIFALTEAPKYQPLPRETALDIIRPLLEDPTVGKIGHNIKYDLIVLKRAGIELRGIVLDTMVASHLTAEAPMRHNLDELSLHHLKRKTIPIADLIGRGSKAITFDHVPLSRACEYASEDADITWRLADIFRSALSQRGVEALYRDIEGPLIEVLARMEMAGIAIDTAVFDSLREEIGQRLKELEQTIFELAGEPFNINSPKQLQEILFDRIGLEPIHKTKTGYSTNVAVLEELAPQHPLPANILEYRTLEKLRGTYVDALPRMIHPQTKRIHTSFNQAVVATGRLSSSDPNLQNIPVRTELGRRIRQGFVPGQPNSRLISADYSQIELRVLAHLADEDHLREAFENDMDIHSDTASRIFDVPLDAVTPDLRRQAKAVNFGVIYGISGFGLARNLGIPQGEAQRFIDQYFARYPKVHTWIESTLSQAREMGYVSTLLGRRRYMPDLNSSNGNTRRGAERVAMNTPVQGTAADIIKVAMLKLDISLGDHARMLLQVHDELLVETEAAHAEEVATLMRTTMEDAYRLTVPLKVDVGIGNNWDEIH